MTTPPHIPEDLARTAVETRGAKGEAWISTLPRLIAECEKRWSLDVEEPFANLSRTYAKTGSATLKT
jgi:hypothetical protein